MTDTYRSPTHAWTDSPAGNYTHGSNNSLAMKDEVDLSGVAQARLTFWDRYSLAAYDYAYVDVSTDNGQTWTNVFNHYYSANTGWTKQTVDLSAYAGRRVKVRFRLDARSHTNVADGWTIDDVTIEETAVGVVGLPFYDPCCLTTTKTKFGVSYGVSSLEVIPYGCWPSTKQAQSGSAVPDVRC